MLKSVGLVVQGIMAEGGGDPPDVLMLDLAAGRTVLTRIR